MSAMQTDNKAMRWRQSKGSTIAEYNDHFMNRARVAESCGGTFLIPGVIDIVLKYKHSGVSFSELESTAKKALKNEVRKRLMAVLFIDNSNSRIYSELLKTLENDYLMGQDKYPRDIATA